MDYFSYQAVKTRDVKPKAVRERVERSEHAANLRLQQQAKTKKAA